MKRKLIFISLLILSVSVQTLASRLNFHSLDVRHGVSDNNVQSILKDHLGFMWFATSNRLTRYDGYHFKEYSTLALGAYNDNVEWIAEDASGRLWLKTPVNYCYYNREADRIENDVESVMKSLGMPSAPERIFIDRSGRLWALDKGTAFVYDHDSKHLSKYRLGNMRGIVDFAARGDDAYVLFEDGEIRRLDTGVSGFERIGVFKGITNLGRLMIDSRRNLWFHEVNGSYLKRYSPVERDWTDSQADMIVRNENLAVMALQEDSTGNLWIGTDNSGIILNNERTGSLERIFHNPREAFSLPSNHIMCFYLDDRDVMWVGSSKLGVGYVNLHDSPFENILPLQAPDVCCLVRNPADGSMLLGCDGLGIVRLSDSGEVVTVNDNMMLKRVITGCVAPDGRLWWGTYGNGVYCMDHGSVRSLADMASSSDGVTMPAFVRKIESDRNGNIWIGTYRNGAFCYRTDGTVRHFDVDNSVLLTNYIADICRDPDGAVLFVTSSGIYRSDDKGMKITDMSLTASGDTILQGNSGNCILADSRGLIWVGSHKGVTVYDTALDSVQYIGTDNNLSHTFVRAMVEDADGNIWLSSDHGVSQITVAKGKKGYDMSVLPFYEESGISELTFNNLAAAVDSDGHPVFGGVGGVLRVTPELLGPDRVVDMPIFTDLYISNHPVLVNEKMPDGSVPLTKNISLLDRIELSHNNNTFALDVSTMGYGNRLKARYMYRINGGEWQRLEGNRIYFNNLAPAEYVLEVKDDLPNSVGPTPVRSLEIVITPPFWLSNWAFVIYGLLFAAGVVLLIRAVRKRHNRMFETKRRELEADKKHQMDEAKMKFFTNISHDLRTPLSLIKLPVEKLLKSEKAAHIRSDLEMIDSNVSMLLEEMNQLLDFRKLDGGNISLTMSHGDLTLFAADVARSFTPAAERAGLSLEVDSAEPHVSMDFDHNKVKRILMNLISNAIKYNVPGGTVRISVGRCEFNGEAGAGVSIVVADTGVGIKEENRDHIFERFFQEDHPELNRFGGGIGLHIVKEYVEAMGGNIVVEDNSPKGSVFRIVLPYVESVSEVPAAEEVPESVSDVSVPDDGKKTLLVVEDNADLRRFLMTELSADYSVVEARDGVEALEKLAEGQVDIVISDVMMPRMEGTELCRRIKGDIETSHIPVILLTAKTAEENVLGGLRDGADDYIPKPFNMEFVKLRIAKFVELSSGRRARFAKMDVTPSDIAVSSIDERLVSKAIEIVEQHMSDDGFSVEDLSKELGMSRGHLYKKLMAIVGRSPLEFIRLIRLKRGRSLLEQNCYNVAQVADMTGMSPTQFAKYFKEEFGVVPSQYAKDWKARVSSPDLDKMI